MTPEMMFECLLVSEDSGVLRTLDRVLGQLSIHTSVCVTPSCALELARKRHADLIVVDSKDDGAVSELLDSVWNSTSQREPTIVVISDVNRPIAGAHVVLRKPFTAEGAEQSLKAAYRNMVKDYRRHARFAVMSSVMAKDQKHRPIDLTVTDINQAGVGLCTKENLTIGDVLTFDLLLPGTNRVIHPHVRVLWTRPHGVAGSEFYRIFPHDFRILQHWLESRYRVKRPLSSC